MKKSMILLFMISMIVMTMLVINCQQSTSSSGGDGGGGGGDDGGETKTYAIGDTGPSGIGIVFYISNGGLHGLEAAPSLWNGGVTDPTSVWSDVDSTLIGVTAQGTAIGTGLANSNAIIGQAGHTTSVAKLCRDYTGGGKTDWFLPSIDELDEMWTVLASTPDDRTTYGFAENAYWSSSEVNDTQAWYEGFVLGITANDAAKFNNIYVRAVRAF